MLKPLTVVAATGAAVLGATSLAGGAQIAAAPHHHTVRVVAVLGPEVAVPAGQFVAAYAYCPKGFYVTGGGAYSGAITEIASSPTTNLRGWFVEGQNNDPANRTFHHRADAVCVKGTPPVTVGPASDPAALLQAEREAAAAR
jgi:hypothetical protein